MVSTKAGGRRPSGAPDPEIRFACPRCQYVVDTARAVWQPEVPPQVGDISICLRCGAPLVFESGAAARWLTFDEVMALDSDLKFELFGALVAIVTVRPSGVVARKARRPAMSLNNLRRLRKPPLRKPPHPVAQEPKQ